MENSLILYNNVNFNIDQASDDGDEILNPGESFNIDFTISNNSFYLDATNVTGTVQSMNDFTENYTDISFNNSQVAFGDIDVDQSGTVSVSGQVNTDVLLGIHNFELIVESGYIDLNGEYNQTTISYPFTIDVSLNQSGFPFDTNSEVRPSPAIVDLDGDGNSEIIFGDNAGLIHVLDAFGNPVFENTFCLLYTSDAADE